MARKSDTGPPYNFTDRIPSGQRVDRNGWYFRPEPRTFCIVAHHGGFMYVTEAKVARDYTLWFYDLPICKGRWELVIKELEKWSGSPKIDTKGD